MLLRVQADFDVYLNSFYYFSLVHSFAIGGSDSLFDPRRLHVYHQGGTEVIRAMMISSSLTYAVVVCLQDLAESLPSYFATTKIADWRLESYILQTGKTDDFCIHLTTISRIKRLPQDLIKYVLEIRIYYCGLLGRMKMELAGINAEVTLKDKFLTSKKHMNVQKSLEHDFEALSNPPSRSLGPESSIATTPTPKAMLFSSVRRFVAFKGTSSNRIDSCAFCFRYSIGVKKP